MSDTVIPVERIERATYLIRGQKVMLDRDLAVLYGVETKALKQAVRRNSKRFPDDFAFVLDRKEFATLRSHFVTSKSESRGGTQYLPMAFTVDADSAYYYEEDDVYAEYNEHTFIQDTDKSPEVNVIRVDENCVVVQLAAVVECNVHCSFSFYMWDGEDKEYMSIGCSSPVSKESYETDILLHLTGGFSYGMDGIEVDQVEILAYKS